MDFFRLKPINNDTEYEVVSELFCYNCEKFVPEIVSQKEVPRRGGIFNVSAIVIPSCFKGKPITKSEKPAMIATTYLKSIFLIVLCT